MIVFSRSGCFLPQDAGAGLLAAAMIAVVPGYISRSVAGSYDNEGELATPETGTNLIRFTDARRAKISGLTPKSDIKPISQDGFFTQSAVPFSDGATEVFMYLFLILFDEFYRRFGVLRPFCLLPPRYRDILHAPHLLHVDQSR